MQLLNFFNTDFGIEVSESIIISALQEHEYYYIGP